VRPATPNNGLNAAMADHCRKHAMQKPSQAKQSKAKQSKQRMKWKEETKQNKTNNGIVME